MNATTRFKAYLAILITVAVIGLVYLLMTIPIPAGAEKTLFMALGGLLTQLGTVVAYFFGSSEGSQRKTEIISQAQPVNPVTNQ